MALRSGSLWWPMKALVFGILAIVLSFVAYNKRVQVTSIQENDVVNSGGVCIYFGNGASAIAISALITLFIEQLDISFAMSCFCCGGERFSPKCSSIVAIIAYIFSWFSFVIAMTGLIYTAVMNRPNYLAKHNSNSQGGYCFVGKENVMLGAAGWCIITVVSSIISYAFWEFSGRNNNYQQETLNLANNEQGVAMGHPHTQLPKEEYGV